MDKQRLALLTALWTLLRGLVDAHEKYYASLATEAKTKTLPSVMTKIRDESSIRFLHNLKNYRQDVYKIIDDDTYEIISNGTREVIC